MREAHAPHGSIHTPKEFLIHLDAVQPANYSVVALSYICILRKRPKLFMLMFDYCVPQKNRKWQVSHFAVAKDLVQSQELGRTLIVAMIGILISLERRRNRGNYGCCTCSVAQIALFKNARGQRSR